MNKISLYEDRDGRIWVGTRAGAYVAMPTSTGPLSAFAPVQGAGSFQILSLLEARPGEMWLGTYGDGIAVVDASTLATTHIRHDPLLPNGLNDGTLWAMQRDDAGNILLATNRAVSRFDPNQHAILTMFGVSSRK